MAYLFDGGFVGFLYSMKETGRKLKDGAKELVEDFLSGFNGYGWKLWKKDNRWRMEIDDLLVRKSFTTFEHIISQITSIRGAQSITQGHGKIKSVTVKEADVHEESIVTIGDEDFSNSKWNASANDGDEPNIQATKNKLIVSLTTNSKSQQFEYDSSIKTSEFAVEVSNLSSTVSYSYYKDGALKWFYIRSNGEYIIPANDGSHTGGTAGFYFMSTTIATITLKEGGEKIIDNVSKKTCYCIEIEDDENSIVEYDLIQCLKGGRYYYVQVGSVYQYYINVPISEFDSNPTTGEVLNPPQVGDEIVQIGNVSKQEKYKNRHSAIYLHTDENEPAIDLMTDIYTKDWSKAIKVRLGGNLPNTDGDRGLYCVNGKLLFVDDNGDTISVLNPDGSASFARGKIYWTKDGVPYFKGRIIAGEDEKKRIEINPDTATIEIFADDGTLVNTFEGNDYESEDALFEGNLPSFTPKVEDGSVTVQTTSTSVVTDTKEFDIVSEGYFTTESGVAIDIGSINFAHEISGTGNFMVRFDFISAAYDAPNGNLLYEKQILNATINEGNAIRSFTGFKLSLGSKGTYRVFARITVSAASAYGTSVTAKGTYTPTSFSISKIGYVSKFFANGFALGLGTQNIFAVYKKKSKYYGEKMVITYDNGYAGFKAGFRDIMIKSNPLGVAAVIPFIYPLRYAVFGRSLVTAVKTATHSVDNSFDRSNQITVAVSSPSTSYFLVNFTYPTSWQQYNFNMSARVEVNIEAYLTNQPPMAYLNSQTDSGFSVIVFTPNNTINPFIIRYKILML